MPRQESGQLRHGLELGCQGHPKVLSFKTRGEQQPGSAIRALARQAHPGTRTPQSRLHRQPPGARLGHLARLMSGQAGYFSSRELLLSSGAPPPHQATLPLQPFISPTGRAHPLLSFAASHSCHLAQCPRSGTGDDCLRAVLQQGRGSGVWLPSEPILLLCGLD